ncbi:protein of unknown function DUF87 [Denitrovibrio acetiphilus DSM 12809]|uniref:Helicase HerA central domain-containing protein n=1 Tax=Denitrovibrio acetiphilus (strain DSM 12809 / NBRC 114555 / N2460) TaxID=522772 RepID=D4H4U7_DENA2|nr:ATP-binding protein [Denitrovibrio acetiphilus]ADD67491.1 protein of unknown function DUF87 [Denitrovibrio acetiphilus DSM 12809]
MKSYTEVGEVASVNGNVISVKLNNKVKSNMPIINGVVYRFGQIGSFMKIPLGYTNLIGIVTQIGSDAIPEALLEKMKENFDNLENHQWLRVSLVGEQVAGYFERGVSQTPTTGDKVHFVTLEDLDIIYGGFSPEKSISIGNISFSESLKAKLDLDKLVSRHCAVLGSTGSGKSNTVSVILNAIIEKDFPRSRILVIDPHGEYNSALGQNSRVYRVGANSENQNLYVPYWALPFKELMSIFSGHLTDPNVEHIREKILNAKIHANESSNLNIQNEIITADTPIPFDIKDIWFELDDFERRTLSVSRQPDSVCELISEGNKVNLTSNEYPPASTGSAAPYLNFQAKGILTFLDSMRNKLKDSRYSFLFKPGPYSYDKEDGCEKDLSDLLHDWLCGDKTVTILDLSGVPAEIMTSISGTLLNIIYDALFWGQNFSIGGRQQPLLIVLEEAHNYLKSGLNSYASRTVQTIAKEGRKYGVGLLLATQRPSEIDETVLSQCGTVVALRMNNAKDRGHIRSAIQDELQTLIDLLPSLRTGEGIISGEAVKIPSRVQFYKSARSPKSSDPEVTEMWKLDIESNIEDYKQLVVNWRNKQLERR